MRFCHAVRKKSNIVRFSTRAANHPRGDISKTPSTLSPLDPRPSTLDPRPSTLGEIFCNGRLPMKNKLYLASLTDEEEYVGLHQHNKSFNALWTLSIVKHSGSLVRAINISVRSILPYIPATLLATA